MLSTSRNLAAIILIILVAGTTACLWTAVEQDRIMRDQLLTQSRIAVVGIDESDIRTLSGSIADLSLPEYAELKAEMASLRAADPDVRFAYLVGKRADGTFFFLVDSEPPESPDYSPPGQPYPEVPVLIRNGFIFGQALTGGPDSDRWGTWVSSVNPIHDSRTGATLAVFGMDVDAKDWYWKILIACMPPLAAMIIILMLVLALFTYQQRNSRSRSQTLLFLKTQQALVLMSKLPVRSQQEFLQAVAAIDARTIGIERVSIWMFTADRTGITCSECYTLSGDRHTSGASLLRSDYPRYFAALDEDRIIAAEQARTDERTAEFTKNYLVPLGIVSMLDVPIRRGGRPVGIICHESTGTERSWDPLEQDFAASTADLIASALERHERIMAEEALARSEQRYRGVVEDQTDLITRFRPDRTRVFVNDAFCRFFSVDRDKVIGTDSTPPLADEDRARFAALVRALTPASPVAEITHRAVLDDGRERWLSWMIRGIFSGTGDPLEYQAVGRDVTWQKQMEETLSLTNRKLGLLSDITRHDVLNQIIILKGFLQLSQSCQDQPEKYAQYMEKSNRAIATIEAQINFTRIYQDMGSIAPSWQDVSLCIVRARGSLPAADIRTELHRPGIEVFADPLLEKVFYNLFDNALRYGGPGMKTIRITSAEQSGGLLITCADDGAGIADSDKRLLFTQGFGKNTGFGLFLSREILAISGITIRETGTPGSGARFEILVPPGRFRYRANGSS